MLTTIARKFFRISIHTLTNQCAYFTYTADTYLVHLLAFLTAKKMTCYGRKHKGVNTSINTDSVMMNQHEQHLKPETGVPQWNSAIINLLFTPTFLTVTRRDNCEHLLTDLTDHLMVLTACVVFLFFNTSAVRTSRCLQKLVLKLLSTNPKPYTTLT